MRRRVMHARRSGHMCRLSVAEHDAHAPDGHTAIASVMRILVMMSVLLVLRMRRDVCIACAGAFDRRNSERLIEYG